MFKFNFNLVTLGAMSMVLGVFGVLMGYLPFMDIEIRSLWMKTGLLSTVNGILLLDGGWLFHAPITEKAHKMEIRGKMNLVKFLAAEIAAGSIIFEAIPAITGLGLSVTTLSLGTIATDLPIHKFFR